MSRNQSLKFICDGSLVPRMLLLIKRSHPGSDRSEMIRHWSGNNSRNDPSKMLWWLHEKYSNQSEKSDADNSIVIKKSIVNTDDYSLIAVG